MARRLAELRAVNPFGDGFLSDITGFLLLYAGDLSSQADRLAQVGINTDNRPRIEWLAPRTRQAVARGEARWLTGAELADLYDEINRAENTPGDRLLQGGELTPRVHRLAGNLFYRAELLASEGYPERALALRREAYRWLGRSAASQR